jgi:hypothetical protein
MYDFWQLFGPSGPGYRIEFHSVSLHSLEVVGITHTDVLLLFVLV